jgi:hypothetical protein
VSSILFARAARQPRWFRISARVLFRRTLAIAQIAGPLAWIATGLQPGYGRLLPVHVATPTMYSADGSISFQRMDGFGVNANPDNWRSGQLRRALDRLVDNLNARIWRVEFDGFSRWEAVNDDADPFHFNWSYYTPLLNILRGGASSALAWDATKTSMNTTAPACSTSGAC